MYKIFLHISCITILEICFFFYYIGPLETDIFYSYIRRIIKEPLKQLDKTLDKWNINRRQFIEEIYTETENDNFEKQLVVDRDDGKNQREKDNKDLFYTTIEYWSFILLFSFFLFLCQYIYFYRNLKHNKSIEIVDDEFIENGMVSGNNYRKHSIDEEELEAQIEEAKKKNFIYVCVKTSTHYIIFGISIITFQYLFFQYVVFEYKPLSIEEIKYFVYQYLIKNE